MFMDMNKSNFYTTCVIVAHPDDETLWMGGTMLMHSEWTFEVYTLCRASDPDRAPKFYRAISVYGASGRMADLDDGSSQQPLSDGDVQKTILEFLERRQFDRIITHGLRGEYTRHLRHEEVSRAVVSLWVEGKIHSDALWFFAYTDGDGEFLPRAATDSHLIFRLPEAVWKEKYRVITDVYGFAPESWEARTTPKIEAFRCFDSPSQLKKWIKYEGIQL
jgi:LmbE family N-acetylglucosaminyl deacetylase